VLFGLAHVLDARGDFDRAARILEEANALQHSELRRRGRGYIPAAHRAFVDQLIATFSIEFFERTRGFGLETERPVFVVGLPRSGTTLVEQILGSHPRAFPAGELRLMQRAVEGPPASVASLDAAAAKALAQRHLDALDAIAPGADRVIDKMPENLLYLGLIAVLFPRAAIIHCRRDLRDVALSCWITDFGEIRWASDVEAIRSRIFESRRVFEHWRRVLPTPVLEVDYEQLVADPETHSRRIVEHCRLDWSPACLNFAGSTRAVRTASTAQVRSPIYRTSVGRWRNYEKALAPLFAGLAPSS
jgi:hypothetical protein